MIRIDSDIFIMCSTAIYLGVILGTHGIGRQLIRFSWENIIAMNVMICQGIMFIIINIIPDRSLIYMLVACLSAYITINILVNIPNLVLRFIKYETNKIIKITGNSISNHSSYYLDIGINYISKFRRCINGGLF